MKNNKIIAGVDEVGRGCLAGPVVAAAVILNKKINLKLLVDSKKINFQNRLKIAEHIKENSFYSFITEARFGTSVDRRSLPLDQPPRWF